jgi:hypothetical protein
MDNSSKNYSRDELPAIYDSLFNSDPRGRAVLDHLHTAFNEIPPKHPLDALDLAYKEGQRSVLRFMVTFRDKLNRANATNHTDKE